MIMNGISYRSAPNSRMNRIKGIRFTRNRQNTRSSGKFFGGNPTRRRHSSSSQVTSAKGIPFSDESFFSKLKFRVFCFS